MDTPSPSFTYRLLRFIAGSAADVYFYNIQSTGQERIPDGPLILAANHPNSLMDTVVLATQTPRQISYMARSGLFKKGFIVRAIFKRIGVIPIYRTEDLQGRSDLNDNAFARAFEVLEEGGCIGIFPEGHNSPAHHVQELKTGTARIALSTEAQNDFQLGVKIMPVGLNFDEPERFLSGVLIRYAEPIDVREFKDIYLEDQREAVRLLTERLQQDLRRATTHIKDIRNTELVGDVYKIYGNELAKEFIGEFQEDFRPLTHKIFDGARPIPGPKPDLNDRFTIEQHIARAIDYYQQHDPGTVARVRMDIRRYRDHLRQVRLRHDLVEKRETFTGRRRWEALKMTVYALALGPVAIFGFINNAIPYALVRLVTSKQPDRTRIAFSGFATGLMLFPLFYFLQSYALWRLTDHTVWSVIVYLFLVPVTGLFFLRWWRQILAYRDRILSRTLFRSQKNLVMNLDNERLGLINSFEQLKNRYIEALFDEAQSKIQPAEEVSEEISILESASEEALESPSLQETQ